MRTAPTSLYSSRVLATAYLLPLYLLLMTGSGWCSASAEEITVEINDNELSLLRFSAAGEHLIIWVSPGFGNFQRAHQVADAISQRGIEVWYIDLAESLFLPQSTGTLRALDGSYVAGLIKHAYERTGKKITLMSRSYGALPVLRGARRWQQQAWNHTSDQPDYLLGAVLFSPELYSEIPPLGMDPVFDPIASSSNIPIVLYQASKRGNRWQLDETLERLRRGGASVEHTVLLGVTGVFYLKDTADETLEVVETLPAEIERAVARLELMPTPKHARDMQIGSKTGRSGLDITLKPFVSEMQPLAIMLRNADGELFKRDDFRGRVTLVNFWASWCGPCVEEIPALNRLRERMEGKPFELISINYAEKSEQIRDFLEMVRVDFPVLLDEDGSYSAKWNVLVYPATFVIATDGNIAYGVNGAIEWDSDEIIDKLEALMDN